MERDLCGITSSSRVIVLPISASMARIDPSYQSRSRAAYAAGSTPARPASTRGAGRRITVVASGRRRLAVVTGPAQFGCTRDRTAGFLSALEEAGVPFDPRFLVEGDFTRSGGREAFGLLRDAIDRALTPDALSGAKREDEALEGVEDALLRTAARAPAALAIDDLQWADAMLRDQLAVVARSLSDLPFLLGTWGAATIRACAAEIGEVKVGGTANPELVPRFIAELDAAAERRGRPSGAIGLCVGCVSVVDRDGSAARDLARRKVALYLPVIAGLDPTKISRQPHVLNDRGVALAVNAVEFEALNCATANCEAVLRRRAY